MSTGCPIGPRALSGLLLIAVGATACGDSPMGPDVPGSEPQPEIVSAELLEVESPLVRRLELTVSDEAGLRVDWGTEGQSLAVEVEPGTDHLVTLARLRAARSYEVRAVALADEPDAPPVDTATLEFDTAPLPEDLAGLEFTAEGSTALPLTRLEIVRNPDGFAGVVIIDEEGEVVWYRREGVAGSTWRDNGNLVINTGTAIREIAVTGEVVRELPEAGGYHTMHHDVITTPDNTLLFIAQEHREVGDTTVVMEGIWEWDPESGTGPVQRWSAWDHYSYPDDRGRYSREDDWLHANSIHLGPDGNILMSLAYLDQVISITPDFQEVEWRMGGPGATIEPTTDAEFFFQHTAAELPATSARRVLLFDNGRGGRTFSRALELEIDPEAGTATRVWEFVAPNQNYSSIVSSARRLENGNTFVTFGAVEGLVGSRGPVEVYEVRPDGSIVWHMAVSGEGIGDPFVLYRATPTGSLAGEVVE